VRNYRACVPEEDGGLLGLADGEELGEALPLGWLIVLPGMLPAGDEDGEDGKVNAPLGPAAGLAGEAEGDAAPGATGELDDAGVPAAAGDPDG